MNLLSTTILIFVISTVLAENKELEDEQLSEITTEKMEEYFQKCYDEIGCVEVNSNWYHEKFRPVNLKPADRMIIKTDFILIQQNKTNNKNLYFTIITPNIKSFETAGYNKNRTLFLLIHDFTSNGYTGWIKHLANNILTKENCNIVSVDWQHGAGPPYDQAVSNARVVGLEIIYLIKVLKENNKEIIPNQIHLIGHGLGAHIAGYVGTAFGNIKKITGLDPSGPRFDGMPDIVKLDHTDGDYVEILHTDAQNSFSQGTNEHLGHSDFFINNADKQPGCKKEPTQSLLNLKPGNLASGEIFPGCSHKRSFKYFIESLERNDCTFWGVECDGFKNFSEGRCTNCGDNCRTFGLSNNYNKTLSAFYLSTASKPPFCQYQYKVVLAIQNSKKRYLGHFAFILIDKNDQVTSSSKGNARDFLGGQNSTFVFYAGRPKLDSVIKEARVGWKGKSTGFCVFGCTNAIYVEKLYITRLEGGQNNTEEPSVLCPKDNMKEIMDEDYQTFLTCTKKIN